METVETLNQRLLEHYGKDVVTGHPLFRIVFSDDQFEKRFVDYSREGFQLLAPRVEERPKYKQYIHHKYLIERFTIVPQFVETDLVEKWSYECIWVFEDKSGNPLPPKWEVCVIVINQVHKAAERVTGIKQVEKDPLIDELDPKLGPEIRKAKIDKLMLEMFGNETDVTDALATKNAVVVPGPQEETK